MTSGSGATNGAGIEWFTLKVWTVPVRSRSRTSNFSPPHPMHAGCTDGGTFSVPHSTH